MDIDISGMNVEQLRAMRAKIDAILDGPGDRIGDLNGIVAEMQSTKSRIAAVGKAAIAKSIIGFMNAYPAIHSIRWKQYTPYFNDGDECVFGVREPGVKFLDNLESEEGDYEDGYEDAWSLKYQADKGGKHLPDGLVSDLKALAELFSSAKDAFKITFGDHVMVTVGRDGVAEIEEYEHD